MQKQQQLLNSPCYSGAAEIIRNDDFSCNSVRKNAIVNID